MSCYVVEFFCGKIKFGALHWHSMTAFSIGMKLAFVSLARRHISQKCVPNVMVKHMTYLQIAIEINFC